MDYHPVAFSLISTLFFIFSRNDFNILDIGTASLVELFHAFHGCFCSYSALAMKIFLFVLNKMALYKYFFKPLSILNRFLFCGYFGWDLCFTLLHWFNFYSLFIALGVPHRKFRIFGSNIRLFRDYSSLQIFSGWISGQVHLPPNQIMAYLLAFSLNYILYFGMNN